MRKEKLISSTVLERSVTLLPLVMYDLVSEERGILLVCIAYHHYNNLVCEGVVEMTCLVNEERKMYSLIVLRQSVITTVMWSK